MRQAAVRCQLAQADIELAARCYLDAARLPVAERFVAAVEAAVAHAVAHPDAGSARYARILGRPGLRFWPVKGFPYLVFHRAAGDRLDVWRVLHAVRDMPAWLGDTEQTSG